MDIIGSNKCIKTRLLLRSGVKIMKKKNFRQILLLVVILIIVGLVLYKLMNSRSYQILGNITNRVDTNKKVVALTFDDGPTDKTEEILEILDNNNVRATFFLMGSDLEKNIDKGKLIIEKGNEIGNHSYSHERNVLKSLKFIKEELNKTNELIRETGYKGEITFRPPFGKKLFILPYFLKKYNMESITWDVEPDTFYSKCDDKVKYTLENVKPGSIILLHPMYNDESLKSIDKIINRLKDQGYEFITISKLLELKNKQNL